MSPLIKVVPLSVCLHKCNYTVEPWNERHCFQGMKIQIAFFFLKYLDELESLWRVNIPLCVCVGMGGGEVKGQPAVSSSVLLAMPSCITFQGTVHVLIPPA